MEIRMFDEEGNDLVFVHWISNICGISLQQAMALEIWNFSEVSGLKIQIW